MFPSLRLGFCVVPASLAGAFANARAIADRNSPIAEQAALTQFIDDGHYDRHLRRVRMVCEERYDAMHRHFTRVLGDVVTLGESSAGTHVLGWINNSRGKKRTSFGLPAAVARAATERGLVMFPLSRYCLAKPARDALVLGYGGLNEQRIARGVEELARCIRRELARKA